MIYEISDVKQESEEETIRWFTDNEFWDLYTWNREGEPIHRFQIYFNREVNEKVLLWDELSGLSSAKVNNETTHYSADWGTPVLYPLKIEDDEIQSIRHKFERESERVPQEIQEKILSVLGEA